MSLDRIYLHEETHLIGLKEYYRIGRLAKEFPLAGQHNDPSEGHAVRSLYFDTITGRIYGKRNSNALVRLRIRNSLESQAELVIRKEMDGVLRREQLPVSREDALKIINGDFSPLKADGSDWALQVYAFLMMEAYRPDVMIECSHIAYEFPAYQARIVFKTNVHAGYDPMKFFESGACGIPVLPEDVVILKAEYNLGLPPFFRAWINAANGEELEGSEYEYLRGRLKPVTAITTEDR